MTERKFLNRKRTIVGAGFAIVVASSTLALVLSMRTASVEASRQDLSLLTVKVMVTHFENHTVTLQLPGSIDFLNKVNIASRISGRIAKIFVQRDDFVSKNHGQITIGLKWTLPADMEAEKPAG